MTKGHKIGLIVLQFGVLLIPFLLVYVQLFMGMVNLPVSDYLLMGSLWCEFPLYFSWFYTGADRVFGLTFSVVFWIAAIYLNTKYLSRKGVAVTLLGLIGIAVGFSLIIHLVMISMGFTVKGVGFM